MTVTNRVADSYTPSEAEINYNLQMMQEAQAKGAKIDKGFEEIFKNDITELHRKKGLMVGVKVAKQLRALLAEIFNPKQEDKPSKVMSNAASNAAAAVQPAQRGHAG